ncbi:hypothetical protein [Falsiporphyromonas endometrii]|uniref:Uncharacterized protein n=1 Tax=Falsiporphyromonas endometrii TaxID=1387297 RepID=A0ABV9K5X7_9PORP
MILFVFEGAKAEPKIYETIKSLYFAHGNEEVIYIFNSNIYALYDRICREYADFEDIEGATDIISLLRDLYPDSDLAKLETTSDIDQIFLFFDYDFQHVFHILKRQPNRNIKEVIEEDNQKIQAMLRFFDEETNMGKLYINYPMVESLKFTKKMPDKDFFTYRVTLSDCHGKFKKIADQFTDYHGYYGLLIDKKLDIKVLRKNWEYLKEQNVTKANFLCNDIIAPPINKEAIGQSKIFEAQIEKYNKDGTIGILNSFPLFIYEYFKS